MFILGDLKAVATEKPSDAVTCNTILSLDEDESVDYAVHALGHFFAQNPSCRAVLLQIRGEPAGYLDREDFHSSKSKTYLGRHQTADFGSSDGGELPGIGQYILLQLVCPFENCDTRVLRVHYDERNPLRCPVHTEQVLKIL